MPNKDPVRAREYHRAYRAANLERIREWKKLHPHKSIARKTICELCLGRAHHVLAGRRCGDSPEGRPSGLGCGRLGTGVNAPEERTPEQRERNKIMAKLWRARQRAP